MEMEKNKKRLVLILVNHEVVIYNFRLELVERLLTDGFEVHISSPYGERLEELKSFGAVCHDIVIDRHGVNPKNEIHIFTEYWKLMKCIRPDVVLTYTIKPNIYGGIAARIANMPYVVTITGLGTAFNRGWMKKIFVLFLYRIALYGAQKVFFQNEENKNLMAANHAVSCLYEILPGSGVNLRTHCYEPYPEDTDEMIFITAGRIMKDKGIDELLEAARIVKKHYPKVKFWLIGFFDEDYEIRIQAAVKEGFIEYIGQQKDIHRWIKAAHAVIHPSYHEGMSNVLLEAAAAGRPVIASDISGCREAFDEKISGLAFQVKNSMDLVRAVEEFIRMPYEQKIVMGKEGRRKMEREFDRRIVVAKYMEEIEKIHKTEKFKYEKG